MANREFFKRILVSFYLQKTSYSLSVTIEKNAYSGRHALPDLNHNQGPKGSAYLKIISYDPVVGSGNCGFMLINIISTDESRFRIA